MHTFITVIIKFYSVDYFNITGDYYISDTDHCMVWKVNAANNTASAYVGDMTQTQEATACGNSLNNGDSTSGKVINKPIQIGIGANDWLYIADMTNSKARYIYAPCNEGYFNPYYEGTTGANWTCFACRSFIA